ncbi:unnamed protein product [Phaeothamnion confervicola]
MATTTRRRRRVSAPAAFPQAKTSPCTRMSEDPLIIRSTASNRTFYVDPHDNGKRCHFGGKVFRCCECWELENAGQQPPHASTATIMITINTPSGHVFGYDAAGATFALKAIPKEKIVQAATAQGREVGNMRGEDPFRELASLQWANADGGHPHVEELVEALEDELYLFKVTPWCESHELGEAFDAVPFEEDEARRFLGDVLSAVAFLHERGICHRDISLENCLLEARDDGSRSVRVVDFGMAIGIPMDPEDGGRPALISPQGSVGKASTMAPEIYHNKQPFDAAAADLFSCGAVAYMSLLGFMPWTQVNDELFVVIARRRRLAEQLAAWGRADVVSAAAVSLLQSMLVEEPAHRLGLEEVLRHPFFAAGAGGAAAMAGAAAAAAVDATAFTAAAEPAAMAVAGAAATAASACAGATNAADVASAATVTAAVGGARGCAAAAECERGRDGDGTRGAIAAAATCNDGGTAAGSASSVGGGTEYKEVRNDATAVVSLTTSEKAGGGNGSAGNGHARGDAAAAVDSGAPRHAENDAAACFRGACNGCEPFCTNVDGAHGSAGEGGWVVL